MLEVFFWLCIAAIAYTVGGFPAVLYVRSRFRRREARSADITPSVTLVIVAFNEAHVIRRRLENALALDYPRDKLSVLLASDGSDDGTVEIATGFADQGVQVLALPRGGKVRALNAAVSHAQGEIVVFSDANGLCAPDALRKLMRPFVDPRIGGVSGTLVLAAENAAGATGIGERLFRAYDRRLAAWQSIAGSATKMTGALYAMRRELLAPVTPGLCDDDAIPFGAVTRGYRLVYAHPPARIAQDSTADARGEFRRKVRFLTQAFQTLWKFRELLNPFRYRFYSLQLFSHKVMRWMLVWPLLLLFAASAALADQDGIYLAAFWVQAVFYGMAALAALMPARVLAGLPLRRLLTLPYYVCLSYAASLRAQWLALRGRHFDLWQPTRRFAAEEQRSFTTEPGRKVAYIMSRFPTVTETFILYEMLEMQRRGIEVDVYPLMRMREAVQHPGLDAIMPRVHYRPLVSASILRSNWHYLRRRRRAYLKTWMEVLKGTFGCFNYFLGALVFTPKSAAVAYELERKGVTHVHAHFATHPALSALVIHRLTGIPFSLTAHGHDVHCNRRMLREKLEAAEFAVSVSEYNRELMVRECGEHLRPKIHVIHCGTDTAFFAPAVQADSGARPLRIVCIATFREVKGHKYLIEACRLLQQRGVGFHCDLVGSGELRADVERCIASVGLSQRFTVHGPQPRPAVRRLLQAADVKVLPSILASNGMREGIPVALMEAMACALPVVSSRLSGIPELVDDGASGLLVAPRDSMGMADALEKLAQNAALRARMGLAGRTIVERDYDLVTNAGKLATLFFPRQYEDEEAEPSLSKAA
jgi:colanic acid/amylovoran biosynthesis glycosyltransferase